MEEFLDQAPFALLYLDKTQRIVGANSTPSRWLNTDRNQMMGQLLKVIWREWKEGEFLIPNQPSIFTLRPSRQPSFKIIWFPPDFRKKHQVSILCRLDEKFITTNLSNNKLVSEDVFIKLLYPLLSSKKAAKWLLLILHLLK